MIPSMVNDWIKKSGERERERKYSRVSNRYSDSINDASHTVVFRYEENVAKVGAVWAILFSVTV